MSDTTNVPGNIREFVAPDVILPDDDTAPAVAQTPTPTPTPISPQASKDASPPPVPMVHQSLCGCQKCPKDFLDLNAVDALGIDVSDHIQSRWKQMDAKMRVGQLFCTFSGATMALNGFKLKSLSEPEYALVKVKNDGSKPGLLQHLKTLGVTHYTTRLKSKGTMFFFLCCVQPESIEFPTFDVTAGKRYRTPTFSLAEEGRLVAIIADPSNFSVVTMLMKKWTRAELNDKCGAKGVMKFWCQIGMLFNDSSYFPPPCDEFADLVDAMGDEYVYSTKLVPHHRCAEYLQTRWQRLRKEYAIFYSRWAVSGQNQPDPRGFTEDLPTLLMHFTFDKTSLSAWAAKSVDDDCAVDDAGDGAGAAAPTRKRVRKAGNGGDGSADQSERILMGCTVYETLMGVKLPADIDDADRAAHAARVRRGEGIMDKCLSFMEKVL